MLTYKDSMGPGDGRARVRPPLPPAFFSREGFESDCVTTNWRVSRSGFGILENVTSCAPVGAFVLRLELEQTYPATFASDERAIQRGGACDGGSGGGNGSRRSPASSAVVAGSSSRSANIAR